MSNLSIILKQTVLNYKHILLDKSMLLLLGAFLLFPMLICTIFVPLRFGLPLVFVMGSLLPSSLFYISRSFAWKSGSVNQQLRTTNVSGLLNDISLFIFFFINAYLLSFILIISFHILGISNLLMENWLGGRIHDYNNVIKLFNMSMIYSIFELIIVMYAIIFFFMSFSPTQTTMYLVIVTLVSFDIVFGSTFNNYFKDIGKLSYDETTGEFTAGIVYYSRAFFPDYFYYPTVVLFPLYGPSQHIATNKFVIDGYEEMQFFHWSHASDMITHWHSNETLEVGHRAFRWNILWFMPYIHTACLIGVGSFVFKIKKEV